jgi:hypothetical protein
MSIAYNKLYPKLLSSVSGDNLDQIFMRIKQPTWYYNNPYIKIPLPYEDIEPDDDFFESERDFNRYYMEYVEERLTRTDRHYQELISKMGRKMTEDNFYKQFNVDKASDEWKSIEKMRQLKFGHKTLLRWYETFRSKLRQHKVQAGSGREYTPEEFAEPENYGYKSHKKIKALGGGDYKPPERDPYKENWFPRKRNVQYQLHHIYKPYTYMIDLMYIGERANALSYLVCVNANTRFLVVETTNIVADEDGILSIKDAKKDTASFLEALGRIRNKTKIMFLRSDDEASFTSAEAKEYYGRNNIIYSTAERLLINNRNMINHTSLAIIDRVIRTIRDIAYNWGITENIQPPVMDHIVKIYNKSPHDTLSKIMGFLVSPSNAQEDMELEKEIIRRTIASNHDVRERDDYDIYIGATVKVYNESDPKVKRRSIIHPQNFEVVGYNGAFYFIKELGTDGIHTLPDAPTLKVPRSKLKLIDWF